MQIYLEQTRERAAVKHMYKATALSSLKEDGIMKRKLEKEL